MSAEETSESHHGISPQPADTCPLIDKAVNKCKTGLRSLKGWSRMEEAELKEAADDAEYQLTDVMDLLEKIREQNQLIRDWGNQWKALAKDHLEKAEPPTPEATRG